MEHRYPRGCLVPAPLVDPDEEHPQGTEAVNDGAAGGPGLVLSGPCCQPRLVVLDVAPADLGDAEHLGCGFDQEPGKGPKCQVGVAHASRSQDAPDLLQVTAHRGHYLWDSGLELFPRRQRRHPVAAQRRWRFHVPPPVRVATTGCAAKTWASMTSAALRY